MFVFVRSQSIKISSFQIDDSNLIIQMVNVNDDKVIDWQKKSKKPPTTKTRYQTSIYTKKTEKETIMCFIIIKKKKAKKNLFTLFGRATKF